MIKIIKGEKKKKESGDILISVLIFAAVAVTIVSGLVNWGATLLMGIRTTAAKEQAFQIAEAGINYYQWHLAHYPNDYKDGTNVAGPYVHSYSDFDTQQDMGQFSLTITPPPTGSTIVTIASTGWTNTNPNIKKTITAINNTAGTK